MPATQSSQLTARNIPSFMNTAPITHDLVLIGGGHAHVEVMRRFGMKPFEGVRITLISRDLHTPYSGMLPAYIAGHYSYDDAHIDLGPLARFAGARLLHDKVTGLDLEARKVICSDRPPVSFDLLSIDTGSAPSTAAPGSAENTVIVKPVSSFHERWQAMRERVLATADVLKIGVVGGGAGGVELLMSVRYHLLQELRAVTGDLERLQFHLITASDDILPTHNPRVRAMYRNVLESSGVALSLGCEVTEVTPGTLRTHTGDTIALDEVLWVTAASAPLWPREAGLATDEHGFIRVDDTLQSVSHAGVFAAGDVASVDPHPRPKSGVFAVRQGPPLANNLRRALTRSRLTPFTPQHQFLSLITTGERRAIASRGNWALEGRWVWQWKDWIDRRFMRRFTDLPAMRATAPTANDVGDAPTFEDMRCGGCGSKLGADLLRDALDELALRHGPDILVGLAQPDDAAVVRTPPGTVSVQTVDAFRSFIEDPWMFGKVAATHALSDIFAMAATPQSALAVATLPLAKESKMRHDLVHMMSGALEVFAAEETALVGGHTGEGAELSLGFAVIGYADENRLLRKTGAGDSDVLVLAKPLGTGILFAGAMQGQARSRWIEEALAMMTLSNGGAARCMVDHGATALTDVTGFGLVGHLLEMLHDQSLAVEFELVSLPVLSGAIELADRNILSSLHPQNLSAVEACKVDRAAREHPHFDIGFDPQTSGGLLAAIPATNAEACVAELRRVGYPQAIVIGRFIARENSAAIAIRS